MRRFYAGTAARRRLVAEYTDGKLMLRAQRAIQVVEELAEQRIRALEEFIAQRAPREAQEENHGE